MSYTLRPYQNRAIESTRQAIRLHGHRHPLLVAPTGAGKTVVACDIIRNAVDKGSRVLFVAHRRELITQCSAKLTESDVSHSYIKAGLPYDPLEPVQLASVQTYARRTETLVDEYDLVIIDEAHHATSDSYKAIIDKFPRAVVIGLTATPYRSDGTGLGNVFDELVEVASLSELTDAGYLVPSRVMVGRRVDLKGVRRVGGGEFDKEELDERVNTPACVAEVGAAWQACAKGRSTLCFANSVAHSISLCSEFQQRGIDAEHIDGTTPEDERVAIFDRFLSGEITVLCNVGVATEGTDLPPVSCIIDVAPTESRCRWKQKWGRGLRLFGGKTDCLVLDHANAVKIHGFLTDPDILSLEGGVSKPKPLVKWRCEECGAELANKPRYCPKCGADHRPDAEEGEQTELPLSSEPTTGYVMVEVDPSTYERKSNAIQGDPAAKLRLRLSRLKKSGKSPMGAVIQFKNEVGHWPTKRELGAFRLKWGKNPKTGRSTQVFA